ncbi:hypothetical protein GCM10027348_40320 [Hymenobacter tenuis]
MNPLNSSHARAMVAPLTRGGVFCGVFKGPAVVLMRFKGSETHRHRAVLAFRMAFLAGQWAFGPVLGELDYPAGAKRTGSL